MQWTVADHTQVHRDSSLADFGGQLSSNALDVPVGEYEYRAVPSLLIEQVTQHHADACATSGEYETALQRVIRRRYHRV